MATIVYKCPQCDAGLSYDAGQSKFVCKFCDCAYTEPDLKNIIEGRIKVQKDLFGESELEQDINGEGAGDGGVKINAAFSEDETLDNTVTFICPECAAEIVADENTAATFCAFCGNPTVLPNRLSGMLKPELIIPFAINKEAAVSKLKAFCKKKPLAPKGFSDESSLDKLTGIYVPFWLSDMNAGGIISGEGTKVTTWRTGSYQYTKTDRYHVERGGVAAYSKIPADGSSKMDDTYMDAIEPYDYSALTDFSMPYLSGFFAEKYDVAMDAAVPRAVKRACDHLCAMLRSEVAGYTSFNVKQNNIGTNNIVGHYALLPVWTMVYKYKGKLYTFALNGQTGKLVGSLPVSGIRALACFLMSAGAVGLISFLISLLF